MDDLNITLEEAKIMIWSLTNELQDVQRLRSWQTDAAAMLKRLEWSGQDDVSSEFCPTCGIAKKYGHASDCALAALLRRIEST